VQKPTAVDAVYVAVAWPKASVDGIAALRVPQAPGVPGLKVNITGSPPINSGPLVTVAVTVKVDNPSAGILDGLATKVTVVGEDGGLSVWTMVVAPRPTVAGSVAMTVQNPTVVEAVYVRLS
jgi:hypothetical protein